MRQEIFLYIDNQEVEFQTPPNINYNYSVTDLLNPTVIKNSFSKTITIQGTSQNNKIFGHIWNVERRQATGGQGGVYFNPSKKADFKLYVDGDLYESGYVKLDKVKMNNGLIEYEITLYGGLGEFFYNLSTKENGEKMTLADLYYGYGRNAAGEQDYSLKGQEFNFRINKDLVKQCWYEDNGPATTDTQAFQYYINFAPCYEGIPDNFAADKVLMNRDSFNAMFPDASASTVPYVLGTLPKDMTTEEMKDYRSYLQRPVIRVGAILNAICDPENNGGYTVSSDFFNGEGNPYFNDTWMTLPRLQELDNLPQDNIVDSLSVDYTGGSNYSKSIVLDSDEVINDFTGSVTANIKLSIPYTAKGASGPDNFYLSSCNFKTYKYNKYHWNSVGSIFLQMVGVNADNVVVAAGNTINLTSEITGVNSKYSGAKYGTNENYKPWSDAIGGQGAYTSEFAAPITDVLGSFVKDTTAGRYIWTSSNGSRELQLKMDMGSAEFDHIEIRLFITRAGQYYETPETLFNSVKYKDGNNITRYTGWTNQITTQIMSSEIIVNADEDNNIRSNSYVTESALLGNMSPCDFLLSYCKMFGLYMMKDTTTKHIYIRTRDWFYHRNEVVDLNKYVDRKKAIQITTPSFEYKYYDFKNDVEKSKFAEKYKAKNPNTFGSQRVDTGYEFNSDVNDLYKNSKLKGAVQGYEKSKYFLSNKLSAPYAGVPPYYFDGFEYDWFTGAGESTTVSVPRRELESNQFVPLNAMKYYDISPKVQFEDGEHKALDGAYTLLFYRGLSTTTNREGGVGHYFITDDIPYMSTLNDGPCWLFTINEYQWRSSSSQPLVKIGHWMQDGIPSFERYITNSSNNVIYSLDFGNPTEDFMLGEYAYRVKKSTIYDYFWDTYIPDMYDINTKVLTCYCQLKERPNPEWLQRFYWFDNAIWRLNKITDWNVSSFETTKMEFIKVQDIDNYTNREYDRQHRGYEISLSTNFISYQGGYVDMTVSTFDDGSWSSENDFFASGIITATTTLQGQEVEYEDGFIYGTGDTVVRLYVNPYNLDEDSSYEVNIQTSTDAYSNAVPLTVQAPIGFFISGRVQRFDAGYESGWTRTGIKSKDNNWRVASKPYWVRVSPMSGTSSTTVQTLIITVDANDSLYRSGIIIFEDSMGHRIEFPVTQEQEPSKFFMPAVNPNLCINCGECSAMWSASAPGYFCPVGVVFHNDGGGVKAILNDTDCIQCGQCNELINRCPTEAIYWDDNPNA